MADENIVTNIVANANFSGLIADVNKVAASLSKLQAQIIQSDARLASQVATMNRSFGENLRRTGQFATHFVTLTSDVEKFGTNLDKGQMKLKQYFQTFQQHTKTQGGLIRELAKQQVALQNAIIQPMGKNAQGLMQYSVHIPQGLDSIKNKTALAKQELQIMNKVIQDGGVQMINWGKNTQWAGRQLTVGLTVPLAAFGTAASKAFREADAELTRLTKVYGGIAATSATELSKVRNEVSATAKDISKAYGVSFKDTITLAADIAATGKQGNDLLNSVKETSRLAVLGEVDRQDAMKATLAIQNTFKQNTDQLSESINFLNAVENQTSTSLADLIEAIPKAGPVIQGMGGSVKDLALYLTAMKEGGVNAAEGANALKSALASLINPTKVASEKFASMGIDLGGIVTKNAGNLTETILELQKALDNLDPLQKQQAIEQLFGKFQFARMNALFANLGKQGSQTLQVLDLMKASSAELAGVAGRELSMVTESASGKYRRALEGLKADLASMGEEFLKVQTFFINVTDGILKFINKLPAPIKTILTFVTGLTAIIGPVIMLTGVLANFFGYIIKGASHFKSLFKGGEGWKMLTPEILAAQKAGSLVETTFYSDAKAATVLKTAIAGLVTEFELLQNKAMTGAVSVAPAMSTMAGNIVKGSNGRVVNPNHPLISPEDTRSMSHLNPVAGMTSDQKAAQTIFGVVPGAPKVNQKIGNNPQMYMSGDLPKIPGLTSVGGASTGIVAAEAAKWHAMTGALAMQSQAEIALLKKEVATTGLITAGLSDSYQALLPTMTKLTANAAVESAAIVAELQAGKITVDQARVKIIQLNAQVESMIAQASVDIAGQQGRSIGLTTVPLLNQPVVNNAGKSNMKELLRPGRTRDLLNKIAGGLGVRTFGAGYSTETTIPKRMANGGVVYRERGSDGPEFKPMGTDTVPAMLTPGEFVVKAGAVTPETLPFLKSLNESGSSRPFLSATMIHQGSEANQALAGNRPGISLTGSYLANDMASLHSRGLHPMALFYDQGVRLGYDKTELKRALNAAYTELQGAFSRKGDAPINNAYYEKTATSIAMKHLKTVSRFSPRIGRDVRLAEELIFMGHQRNAQNKGIQPGSLRTTGFDGTELPRHLVGTGSGFSGAANQTHFNLAQELYDEKPSNLYEGKLGKGNTISQAFGSQRGHIGAKFAPSRWNMLLNMVRSKIGRAPIGPDARSVALTNKWRGRTGFSQGGPVYMADGGMVPSTQYFQEGSDSPVGFRSGFQSQTQRGYLGKGLMSRPEGGGLSMGAQMGIMMGGSMVGQQVGGNTGMAITTAANILPWLPFQKILPLLKSANTGAGALKNALTLAGKAAGLLTRMLPGAAVVGTLFALYKGYQMWQKQIADTRREHVMLNGITEKGAKEAGIGYKNIGNSIKDVRDQLKLQKEAGLSAYDSMTPSGVGGLTLTIAQLKELKKTAKETMPELVGTFNSIDSSKVTDLAVNLKAQFVAAGMSAQDATNKIYAIIEASNKVGQGFGAIASSGFKAITDRGSAATSIINTLLGSLKEIDKVDSKAFASNIDTVISSLDSAATALIGTKDAQGKTITQADALITQFEKLKSLGADREKIGEKGLEHLKKERPELAGILKSSDTIAGVYAKWRVVLAGVNIDLRNITSEQAMGIAAYEEALNMAASASTSNDKVGGALGTANAATKKLTDSIKAGETAVKNASKSEAGFNKAKIKAIQDEIKAIRDRADAKKKALSDSVNAENTELELKKLQLEAQSALARGDRDAYESANLSIEQLTKETQLRKASDKIDANAKKEEAAQQKLLDDDQAKKDKQQAMVNKYTNSGATAAETLKQINDIKSALAQLAIDQIENNALKDPAKKAEGQKSLDGKLQTIVAGLEKASDVVQKAFPEYVDSKTNKGKLGGGVTNVPGVGSFPNAPGEGNQAFSKLVTEIQGGAKANFTAMADSIKGGASLKNVVEAMGGKLDKSKSVTSADLQSALDKGTYNKNIDKTELSKGFLGKDNYLKDDARELIIREYKLQAGDTFKYDNVEYIVKDGFDKWTGQPRAVRRALGGPVSAGQTYAINDRLNPLGYQQEGFTPFTPQMSGIIHPNAATMPKYNIASGEVTGMRGGINSSYNNNSYSISIALNGTNVTADDVVRRFKQELALVNAKEGRSRTVGGQV
jgi:TP901 family phage tail tape measure protein